MKNLAIIALAVLAVSCRKSEPEPPSEGYGTARIVTGVRAGTPQIARLAFTENTANATSPLGVTLAGFGHKTSEIVTLDQMVQASSWRQTPCTATPDQAQSLPIGAVTLDAAGWPATIPAGSCAGALLFQQSRGEYPAGKWLVHFDGDATLLVTGDAATVTAVRAGVASFNVATPTTEGVLLMLKDTLPANPMKRIRVIPPGGVCGLDPTNVDPFKPCRNDRGGEGTCSGDLICIDHADALIDRYASDATQNFAARVGIGAGAYFHPAFLDALKSYRVIGFRRWLRPDHATAEPTRTALSVNLAEHAHTTGAPWELMFALTNVLSADAWITIPSTMKGPVSNDLASVAAAQMLAQYGVYLEIFHEWWLPGTEGNGLLNTLAAQFNSTVPLLHVGIAEPMKKTWDKALGTGRLKMIGNVEARDPAAPAALRFPSGTFPWTHYATALRLEFPSSVGVADLDSSTAKTQTEAMANGVRARGVPMIAYASGIYLTPPPSSNDARNEARTDAALGTAFKKMLGEWKAAGGQLVMLDKSADDESNGPDAWGMRAYHGDKTSALDQAVQAFITENPCWWTGCARN